MHKNQKFFISFLFHFYLYLLLYLINLLTYYKLSSYFIILQYLAVITYLQKNLIFILVFVYLNHSKEYIGFAIMYYFYFFVCNIYLYEVRIFSIEKITRNALMENLIPFGYHFPASANIAHPPSYVSLKYLHF